MQVEREHSLRERQAQRVNELRERQANADATTEHTEELRASIRTQLESSVSNCVSVHAVLRALGVTVDGGVSPTPAQVNCLVKICSSALQDYPKDQTQCFCSFLFIWHAQRARLRNHLIFCTKPRM